MRKIPTVFVRDQNDMALVTEEVHPACQWVLDGAGVATRKYDGTCVLLDDDGLTWWARREVKPGRNPPPGFRPEETDPATGKTVGWEPIDQSPFAKAFATADKPDAPGTYELCGPKINGKPEGFAEHLLVRHADAEVIDAPRDFAALRAFLTDFGHEGIVWHHPDGRMAKLKVRDFAKRASTM